MILKLSFLNHLKKKGFLIFFIFFAMLLMVGCSSVLGPYPKQISPPPQSISANRITINSASGSALSGWYCKGMEDKGGVLLLHGIGKSRTQMLKRSEFLHKNGYSVFLFDFTAHGQSSGEKTTFGLKEALDAEAAYSFLEARVKNKSIGVIGFSMGGAAALLGSVAFKADALVLESVYPSIEEAIENRVVTYLNSPGRLFVPFLSWQFESLVGVSTEDLKPIEHIAKVTSALFIIGGVEDQKTTIDQTRSLYNQAGKPKYLWEIEGAGHEDYYEFTPKEYEKKILLFFDKYLKTGGGEVELDN